MHTSRLLSISCCSCDDVEIDEVIRLHELKIAICEHQAGKFCHILAVHLKSQRVLFDELRYSVQKEDETGSNLLLNRLLGLLGREKIILAEHAHTRHVSLLLGSLRRLLIRWLAVDLRLLEEIVAVVNPLLVKECLEAFKRTIGWVEEKLGERAEQRRAHISRRTVYEYAFRVVDEVRDSTSRRKYILNIGKPIGLHNLRHQVLVDFLHAVSAQRQRPHVIERLGDALIVHIVGAAHDAWVDARAFEAELYLLALVLGLTIRP